MKLIENRVPDDGLHEELLATDPFGEERDGKFVGDLAFKFDPESLDDVCVYQFAVGSMVDEFIHLNVRSDTQKMDGESAERARKIIADLESMIGRLKSVLPE